MRRSPSEGAGIVTMSKWMTSPGTNAAGVAAADVELADTLDNLDGADNYAEWILAQVEPHLGQDVLEVGAGHGTFTEMLSARGYHVVATDVSERCVGILRERFATDGRVTVVPGGANAVAGMPSHDAAVLINVLEHIQDDDAVLREIGAALKPGGRLILWVPAYQALYSDFDRRIGHYRRYTKKALREQLVRAGYDVPEIRYHNTVGALAWLIVARLMRRDPTGGAPVKIYDSLLVPVLQRLEGTWGAPFGQSVFAVATWPGDR
jgi:2-polyprenyl-3-methyl-5-hydroxy-6-metoxy-1,4-benzoquinol methylase